MRSFRKKVCLFFFKWGVEKSTFLIFSITPSPLKRVTEVLFSPRLRMAMRSVDTIVNYCTKNESIYIRQPAYKTTLLTVFFSHNISIVYLNKSIFCISTKLDLRLTQHSPSLSFPISKISTELTQYPPWWWSWNQ